MYCSISSPSFSGPFGSWIEKQRSSSPRMSGIPATPTYGLGYWRSITGSNGSSMQGEVSNRGEHEDNEPDRPGVKLRPMGVMIPRKDRKHQ